MSMSDSDSTSTAGLLYEMLGSMRRRSSDSTLKEIVEKLSKNELSKDEYPCMNDPSPSFRGTQSPAMHYHEAPVAHSMRSRRTLTWAKSQKSDDGYSSDSILRYESTDSKRMGRRIFVFIVGGATRSELRSCHKLSTKLREVILGSTSIDDPLGFIKKLKLLSENVIMWIFSTCIISFSFIQKRIMEV